MSMIRPEITQTLWRAREVIGGVALVLAGLWVAMQGGYLLTPVGAGIGALGTVWAVTAWRRMRFAQSIDAPGIVEIDEGQIGYLGPGTGGYVAIPDLAELRLLTIRGRRLWQLRQTDGQALLIPVDAAGADRLYDAFASLPGMDTAALVEALTATSLSASTALTVGSIGKTLWRRKGVGIARAADAS
jgi:hypothetical protein